MPEPRASHLPIPGPDNPCPVCGNTIYLDWAYLATRMASTGEDRFGRLYICNGCGICRFHDAPPPDWWQPGMDPGSRSQS